MSQYGIKRGQAMLKRMNLLEKQGVDITTGLSPFWGMKKQPHVPR
ncbi:hypothetical protein RCO48_29140 [Peribacillus frigoritolerans]|nr:hypothetical protein [Peribacillus frigoritolerans]